MNNKCYAIGVDFGTLSARAVIIDLECGRCVSDGISEYRHGVLDGKLPSGASLYPDFALQDAEDYIESLIFSVREALSRTDINKEDVIALAIDFTASTVLPVDENGTPLSALPEFSDNPHAYVKLWKHHSASREGLRVTEALRRHDPERLRCYGGSISCEFLFPKLLETLRCAPEVFRRTARFLEAADFVSMKLTGRHDATSYCFSAYKALNVGGYPDDEFFSSLDPALSGIIGTKIPKTTDPICKETGRLSSEFAEKLGLSEKTVIATPIIDAHASMPALGITESGDMMVILGTSACHIINSDKGTDVKGICGYAKDAVIPGLYTYEAGQAALGDIYAWFIDNCLSETLTEEARARGIGIHKLLGERAAALRPGESGLVALDWFNGSRTPYVDPDLSGAIFGLRLSTKPEEIYRALIEATAFGTRAILECFETAGIEIGNITAAGGIAEKDGLLMQIFADVTKREIRVPRVKFSSAYGAAMYAAVAAGKFGSLRDAANALLSDEAKLYVPNPESSRIYDGLYEIYRELSERFGKDGSISKKLREISKSGK